jgi:CBS domain-containing protein
MDRLLRSAGVVAAELMTRGVRTVDSREPLGQARDLMLNDTYGRLPVLRAGDGVIGLLTERDVVAAQSRLEQSGGSLDDLTVGDALPDDGAERVVVVAPDSSRERIVELMRRPGIVACLVTPSGDDTEPPIGIITHADLLYRM